MFVNCHIFILLPMVRLLSEHLAFVVTLAPIRPDRLHTSGFTHAFSHLFGDMVTEILSLLFAVYPNSKRASSSDPDTASSK